MTLQERSARIDAEIVADKKMPRGRFWRPNSVTAAAAAGRKYKLLTLVDS
jgi:hypothetical protein